jgi:hypothetical protein
MTACERVPGGGSSFYPGPHAVIGQYGPVNDFLVVYLDSIDERLLDYLDEEGELRLDTVQRLRYYTTALLDGLITPAALAEDWPDWFDLAPAFVAAYAPDEVEELEQATALLEGPRIEEDVALTEAERAYLTALELQLDMYPDMQATEEE